MQGAFALASHTCHHIAHALTWPWASDCSSTKKRPAASRAFSMAGRRAAKLLRGGSKMLKQQGSRSAEGVVYYKVIADTLSPLVPRGWSLQVDTTLRPAKSNLLGVNPSDWTVQGVAISTL